MNAQITLNLPDRLYKRVKSLAQARQQGIAEAIADYLDNHLPMTEAEIAHVSSISEQTIELEPTPEMQAFIAMHPMLKKNYFGRYVAIYKGKLIDHDTNHEALYLRIDQQYPDEFVWISPVEEEPIPTMVFLSPRIEQTTSV